LRKSLLLRHRVHLSSKENSPLFEASPPFTLNCLVDTLLKKEFDLHRAAGTPHPLMVREGIDAIPFPHPMLDEWRQNFKGMGYLHEPTNLWIRGAIDDLWVNPAGEVIVVDYKATSSATKEPSLDDDWKIQYKRQADVYQWLARRQGLKVLKWTPILGPPAKLENGRSVW
jgi:ATP-dependent exoDNAse (exonuclease V) beta subunit